MFERADHGEEPREAGAEGLLATSRRLAGALAATAANRAELFLVEAQEERDHIISVIALGVVALVLFILAAATLTAVVVILAGEAHRVAALCAVAAAYAVAGVLAARKMAESMRRWESFSATLTELKKDRDWLRSNPPS
jgi:uncharacterized membrane protein YqjE